MKKFAVVLLAILVAAMLAAMGILGWQQYKLAAAIEGIDSRISTEMADSSEHVDSRVAEQQSRLDSLGAGIASLREEVELARLKADNVASEVDNLRDGLRGLSEGYDSQNEQFAKELERIQEEPPEPAEIPAEELGNMSFVMGGGGERPIEIELANDSSWTVETITIERQVPGSTESARLTFEFEDLIAPKEKGSAAALSPLRIWTGGSAEWQVVDRAKWRIVAGVGYEGHWYWTGRLEKEESDSFVRSK